MTQNLSHLNQQGEVHMVDVGNRPATNREAHARGAIRMEATTLGLIQRGETPKGDLLAVARVAAVSYTTSPSPRDRTRSRMPSSA